MLYAVVSDIRIRSGYGCRREREWSFPHTSTSTTNADVCIWLWLCVCMAILHQCRWRRSVRTLFLPACVTRATVSLCVWSLVVLHVYYAWKSSMSCPREIILCQIRRYQAVVVVHVCYYRGTPSRRQSYASLWRKRIVIFHVVRDSAVFTLYAVSSSECATYTLFTTHDRIHTLKNFVFSFIFPPFFFRINSAAL